MGSALSLYVHQKPKKVSEISSLLSCSPPETKPKTKTADHVHQKRKKVMGSAHEVEVVVIEEMMNANDEPNLDSEGGGGGGGHGGIISSLDELEKILGYTFNDQSLLHQAFIHPSFYYPDKSGPSYERLEFIGDSILNLLMTKEIFFNYLELTPGLLTKLRAANVDNEKLARVAIKHQFYRFLHHKNPRLVQQIRAFTKGVIEYPVHSHGLIETPKCLADIVESTIGAIYVDSNCSLDIVWKVFKELLMPIISLETMGKHPMTELNELCQKKGLDLNFRPKSSEENRTSTELYIGEDLYGKTTYAIGSIKKEIAHCRLAKKVLDKYRHKLMLLPDRDDHNDTKLTNN